MKHPELLSPAGSLAGVRAAVQSGADAVYMGFGTFNARRGATNFSREEMAEAIAYCRARGVKTNITFNILTTGREREAALCDARFLQDAGADALIVQDLGLVRLLRHHAPDLALHASTQMTINTVAGAQFAKECGFSRVVLARECTLAQIRKISAEAGIETEVFVHGALCMCYSGQCYLSGIIGQRSGNRGQCAQPCRLPYAYDGGAPVYPLSLRDLSLAAWLRELADAGVASLKIEGRMKRPEYAAIVTQTYADLLQSDQKPTEQQQETLQKVFSRDGFTQGYLTGDKGDAMFGTKTEVPLAEVQPLYDEAARRFLEGHEAPRFPLALAFSASMAEGMRLSCGDVCVCSQEGVQRAQTRETTADAVEKALRKTGGTPFTVQSIAIELEAGLMLPASALNRLRRELLEQVQAQRDARPARRWVDDPPAPLPAKSAAFRGYIAEVRLLSQVTDELLAAKPCALYAPLAELAKNPARAASLAKALPVAAVLPRIYTDEEQPELLRMLGAVRGAGIASALAGNVGQLRTLRAQGFAVYGDFGLNAMNGDALAALAQAGVSRQTLSFELRLSQMRDMEKPLETELLVYGYLPLMVFENCAIRRKTGACTCEKEPCYLTDRKGKRFRLLPEPGCRNTLLNCQPLHLAQRADYDGIGVTYARLRFTVESPTRCAFIARAFAENTPLALEEGATRGLYFRGVT